MTVIGIVLFYSKRSSWSLGYSHQACCLLYYLRETNNGIHIFQFTFGLLRFCFQSGADLEFEQKHWRVDGFGEKMAQIGGFAYPYSSPASFCVCCSYQIIESLLMHGRFWDADSNRKWAVFTFNLPSHNHIHSIFSPLETSSIKT